MAEHYSSFDRSGTRWLLQRLTAAFLVVVLAFHFFLLHFVNHAADVTFAGTSARMSTWTYFSLMVLFLLTATFHGVNGVYNTLVKRDGVDGWKQTAITAVLVVASLIMVVQGLRTALVWTNLF
ncbi:succinate dehydrogenase [Halolamina salifodinae]|uniref:Succinate dehydrogenase / fumarate reductase membrane anchor subunit n=1 Tax=Halolamina salifodinae TaxID=1202767 RepID=A0A8T4H3F6_9EURY|nr:succinate dehydrogenase [Halolamina salifodinae]MBP1988165.1 succinate dehydrogenase / fumarate reductase membrane anchor subunit [Halolamina salifodinae]